SVEDDDKTSDRTMQDSSVMGYLLEVSPEKGNFEVYVERFEAFAAANKIDQATKQRGETISDFVVQIKKLAATCDFGTFLEEALQGRLILGLQKDAIRCKLLATDDKDLTFDRSYSSVFGMEAAQGHSKEVRRTEEPSTSTSVQ
ncbi:hypothetical protein HPB47_005604, partial [Ixodes persulcatus]